MRKVFLSSLILGGVVALAACAPVPKDAAQPQELKLGTAIIVDRTPESELSDLADASQTIDIDAGPEALSVPLADEKLDIVEIAEDLTELDALAIYEEPEVASAVAIETTGTDECGAADYSFLVGESFVLTYDVALPANVRILGRHQVAEGDANPARMNVRVSTRSAAAAATSMDAKVIEVFCG